MATQLETAPAVSARSDGLETVMKILVIDIGGTNVKMLASGQDSPRKFRSGQELTPDQMVARVIDATRDWEYDAVAIGYPGPICAASRWPNRRTWGPAGWVSTSRPRFSAR